MPSREQLLRIIKIQAEIVKLGLDLGGVMQFVVDEAMPLIQADGAAIELAEDGEMVYRAAAGIAEPQLGLRLNASESLSGLCVRNGQAVYCDDAERDTRVSRWACRQMGLRSMIVMPLRHQERTIGVLKALSMQPGYFHERDMELLHMLAEVLAATMYFSVEFSSDQLLYKALHDEMTGLANRALFMERLRQAVARTRRDRHPAGLLMIDMDGLKQINDNHGHRIGDAVIIELGRRLKWAVRETDTAARLGGDEFGVILTPLQGVDGVESAIRRITSIIDSDFVFENRPYHLKASIGSALVPLDGVEPVEVLELADQRMYAAKYERRASSGRA